MRLATCLATLVALTMSTGCTSATRVATPPPDDAPHVKVMTYNVNYGLAGDPAIVDLIRRQSADVVLLQETTGAWETTIRRALSGVYPHMAFKHCCGAGGLAILSKHPIEPREYTEAPEPGWFPAWRVIVHSPLGALQTLNVHLRPPVSDSGSFVEGYFSTPEIRRTEIAAHATTLEDGYPTIIAGDFNESDSGRAVSFLEERGLQTVLPEFHPGANTWRWNTSVGSVSAQLDHITYEPGALTPVDSYVVEESRSDHFPVVAVFTRAQ